MAEKQAQDTLFIDMKYLILYRKLGYKEVSPDVFIFDYGQGISITVEAESQKFSFCGQWYTLQNYKDMVLLECIDRLLKKGYKAGNLLLYKNYDLAVLDDQKNVFAGVYLDGWGKPYEELVSQFSYTSNDTVILYTSQLSGGLIDFKSKIFTAAGIFEKGIFERNAKVYATELQNPQDAGNEYDREFAVKGNELIQYAGNQAIITIPSGIAKIGTGAFWNNTDAVEILLPQTLESIAGDAFVYCDNLKKVIIPSTVYEMGDNPFAGCPKIEIDCLSNEFVLEDGVLFDKTKRILIHYTPSKTDKTYTIPESVEWIGKHSFYKCLNLEEVTITKNAAFMGNNVFSDCANIRLINQSPYFEYRNGVLYNRALTQVFHYSLGSKIKNVVIENGVRTIGRNSFWNAREIETLTIPSSVRQIGYNPFSYCLNMKFINYSPFYKVVDGVLYSSDLKELVCCTSKTAERGIHLPAELISIGRNAFTGCESLRTITLPGNLQCIARGAFSGCAHLRHIFIPASVESIGDWAFNNCVNLQSVEIPAHIKIEPNILKNSPARIIKYEKN
jgi:hypothetical protein